MPNKQPPRKGSFFRIVGSKNLKLMKSAPRDERFSIVVGATKQMSENSTPREKSFSKVVGAAKQVAKNSTPRDESFSKVVGRSNCTDTKARVDSAEAAIQDIALTLRRESTVQKAQFRLLH